MLLTFKASGLNFEDIDNQTIEIALLALDLIKSVTTYKVPFTSCHSSILLRIGIHLGTKISSPSSHILLSCMYYCSAYYG